MPTVVIPPVQTQQWRALIAYRQLLVGQGLSATQNRTRALLAGQGLPAPSGQGNAAGAGHRGRSWLVGPSIPYRLVAAGPTNDGDR